MLLSRGFIRLHRIEYYRTIEDKNRQDSAEGRAHLKVPGNVPVVRMDRVTGEIVGRHEESGHFNWQMGFQNPSYAFCMSHDDVDLAELTGRFGEHVIEITNPEAFLRLIHRSAHALQVPNRELSFVDCVSVRYDKGLVGPAPEEGAELMRISYSQKAPSFAVEREYRCVVVLSGSSAGAPDYLDLKLGSICECVRRYDSAPRTGRNSGALR